MSLILPIKFYLIRKLQFIDLQTAYPVFMELGVNNVVQGIVWAI